MDVVRRSRFLTTVARASTPEVARAFVELAANHEVDAEALKDWCRRNLAHYKAPDKFIFTEIPRTSTGKIQKFVLRERAREVAAEMAT